MTGKDFTMPKDKRKIGELLSTPIQLLGTIHADLALSDTLIRTINPEHPDLDITLWDILRCINAGSFAHELTLDQLKEVTKLWYVVCQRKGGISYDRLWNIEMKTIDLFLWGSKFPIDVLTHSYLPSGSYKCKLIYREWASHSIGGYWQVCYFRCDSGEKLILQCNKEYMSYADIEKLSTAKLDTWWEIDIQVYPFVCVCLGHQLYYQVTSVKALGNSQNKITRIIKKLSDMCSCTHVHYYEVLEKTLL